MVTVGEGVLEEEAFAAFESLRTFDAEGVAQQLHEGCTLHGGWLEVPLEGREAIQAYLAELLGDPVKRPSFSLLDASGDGSVTRLALSVSGRFGKAPQKVRVDILSLKGAIHQIVVRDA